MGRKINVFSFEIEGSLMGSMTLESVVGNSSSVSNISFVSSVSLDSSFPGSSVSS